MQDQKVLTFCYKCRYNKRKKRSSFKATLFFKTTFCDFYLNLYHTINSVNSQLFMAENQREQENKGDDLDLISLFERLFSFVRRYGLLIAIFTIIGIMLGYASYKSSAKRYASTLLLHSFILTNTEQINIIENWNDLLRNGEYTALGERLHCDPQILKKVSKVTAAEIQKLYVQNNPNGFRVDVLVKDNSVLDTLQKGIIYGLENSDYMKARLASKRSAFSELIDKTKTELIKLDSTKRNIENNINNNSQHSSTYLVDISTINTQVIILNEKFLDYQEQLRFTNAVQVLHNFEKFQRPASPKLFKSLVLGLIGGFAIGYIFALYLYVRRKIRSRNK